MTEVRDAIQLLVRELMMDGDLSDADLARIAEATAAERLRIAEEQAWATTAHVHDEPHRSVITFDPDELKAYLAAPDHREDGSEVPPGDRIEEHVDASGMVCHDCLRPLVSDRGSVRILVCPTLHGRRPPALVPGEDGAVECGRPPR